MGEEIKSYSYEGIKKLLARLGQPQFRAKQIVQWLYQKGASSYDEMSNIPASLKEALEKEAPLHPPVISDKRVSSDGTRKYIIRFHDGAETEMVGIPSKDRLTVCFSTQVGCPMGCTFCATGKEGFTRNLLPGEMVDQVMLVQEDFGERVSNVVGMGQGEPLLNYDNVLAALRFLNSPDGLNIGARRITISTCGLLQGIDQFAREPEQFTLAISLHSAIQETRDDIMPALMNQKLPALKRAVQRYQEESGRRVTYEYVMINGVNDDMEHLKALVHFCRGTLCHVNLIPVNGVEGTGYAPSASDASALFLKELTSKGIEATIRQSRGADIAGACGQLKNAK